MIFTTVIIWGKLNNNENLERFSAIIHHLDNTSVTLTIGAISLLMLLNWVVEAYKWRLLVKGVEPISYWTALQSVFCGLSLGIITPNRIGEYGSRMFFLRPRKRIFGLIAMSTGAFSQFVLTNIVAAVAIAVFLHQYKGVEMQWTWIFLIGATVYCTFLMILYYNIHLIEKPLRRLKFMKRYMHFFSILSSYDNGFLTGIMGICLFRLLILIVQYYLIVHLLIPSITFPQVTLMIVLLFSVQTVAPTIDLLDIGVRGATAAYFFGYITHQDVAILATTAIIWLINLIIPGIIGVFFVSKLNIFNKQGS